MASLRAHVRRLAQRAARPAARRLGYDLVPTGYYSVVADLDELGDEPFRRRSELLGIELDPAAQLAFAGTHLAPFFGELDAGAAAPWSPGAISYGAVDGEILYAIVRHLKPRRVVELGSGFSTHLIATAIAVNASEGSPAGFTSYDPFPRVERLADRGHRVLPQRAQDVPAAVFDELEAGDVLFVDTTHTVKVGGDVNRVILDLLPALAPGVVVHFHDILLPGEYYRAWIEAGAHWGEQYLLQAFLCLNPEFEILWASAAVHLDHERELRALVPSLLDHRPSAFWIRRRD